MARVLTNNTALAVAKESSRSVLPGSPTWKSLEPNDINDFGAQITTTPRSPISKLRQRRKGSVTDLDAAVEYTADTTMDILVDFIEGFLYSTAVNGDLTFRGATVTGTGYTIPAATASQASRLQYAAATGPISLVFAAGYVLDANNGLKPLSADVAAAGTEIPVAGVSAETAPTNAEVSIAGIRAEAGDIDCTVSGDTATLTSGNGTPTNQLDFTTLGLTKGQRVFIGGGTDTNRFGSTAAADGTRSFGSGRVTSIAAAELILDKIDDTLVSSDGTDDGNAGTEIALDILFGRFIRNVSVDSSEYLEQYFQFEGEYPNLFETEPPTPVAEPDGYEYVIGCLANVLEWSMPLTDLSRITVGFVATDSEDPVDGASRKTNADTPIAPLFTGALNTSSDFMRLRIADVDDTGLTSDFKDVTVTLNNNATGEKVLGFLGSKYINNGNFEVDIAATALFTSPLVPARIRANTTVTMDWILTNYDGAVAVDIPSMTMGSDGKEFPVNESVRIALTCQAFVDPVLGTSIGVSLFPYYPTE